MDAALQNALRKQDYASADTLIDAWLERSPGEPQAVRLKAISDLRGGHDDLAKARLSELIERDPNDAMAQLLYAQILLPQDPNAAHRYFEAAASADPNLGMAHVGRASHDLRRGDFARAEELFHTALRADDGLLPALVGLVHCRLAQRDLDQAEAIALKAASLHPTQALALLTVGRVFLARERYPFAEQSLRRALELDPHNSAALHLLGLTCLSAGKITAADDVATLELQRNPRDALALELKGDIEAEARRSRRALKYYEQAVQAAPADSRLFQKMINYCFATGRSELGLSRLRETALANPRAVTVWNAWIQVLLNGNRADEAKSIVDGWAEREPTLSAARALAIMVHQTVGDVSAARAHAEALSAAEPGQPSAAMTLASLAIADRDGVRALTELDAIAKPPGSAEVQHRLALLRGRAHDVSAQRSDAIKHFRAASAMVKNDVVPRVPVPRVVPVTTSRRSEGGEGLILLMGLPGSGVSTVAALLERQSGILCLNDRHYRPGLRRDLIATREQTSLEDAALLQIALDYAKELAPLRTAEAPRHTIDWLNVLDLASYVRLSAALPDAQWLMVQRDPRDCLLQLLAVGAGGLSDELAAAKRLRAQADEMKLIAERGDPNVHVLNFDLVLKHGESEVRRALEALGISGIDTKLWPRLCREASIYDMYLPSSHWVAYKTELARPLGAFA